MSPWTPTFGRLLEANQYHEATKLLAFRMTARDAVWWGCLCVWRAMQDEIWGEPTESETRAIGAAAAWCTDPNEARRRESLAAAEDVGIQNATGAVATAAFWSEGSVSLPGCPEVPAPPGVAQKLVGNVVLLSFANQPLAAKRPWNLQALRMGAEILAGQVPWPAEGERVASFRKEA